MRSSNQYIYDIICVNQGHTLKDKLGAGAIKIIICGLSIAHCKKLARKTCPGENKNMTNDGNPKAEPPENEDLENLDGMAKGFM